MGGLLAVLEFGGGVQFSLDLRGERWFVKVNHCQYLKLYCVQIVYHLRYISSFDVHDIFSLLHLEV